MTNDDKQEILKGMISKVIRDVCVLCSDERIADGVIKFGDKDGDENIILDMESSRLVTHVLMMCLCNVSCGDSRFFSSLIDDLHMLKYKYDEQMKGAPPGETLQ